jgi:hypothetical protein
MLASEGLMSGLYGDILLAIDEFYASPSVGI